MLLYLTFMHAIKPLFDKEILTAEKNKTRSGGPEVMANSLFEMNLLNNHSTVTVPCQSL